MEPIYVSSSSSSSAVSDNESPIYISSASTSEDEQIDQQKETVYYKVRLSVPSYEPTNKSSSRQEAERIYSTWKVSYLTLDEMEEIIEDYKAYRPDE